MFVTFGLFVTFGVFVAFMGYWSWTLVAFSTMLAVFMGCWGWTFVAFYNFCGIYGVWCCTFGTCVVFSLCMFLPAQHRWVPLGLVYWGSGFSQP